LIVVLIVHPHPQKYQYARNNQEKHNTAPYIITATKEQLSQVD
jgi:hypothetical protein